jgi:hypothetical protein
MILIALSFQTAQSPISDCRSEIENRKSEIVITLAQKAIVGK